MSRDAAAPAQPRRGGFGPGSRGGPVPVRVATAERQNIDVELRALGTVTPLSTVTVRSRLDGELVRVHFTEGQRVREGDLLAEIDPRPYQVQLAQAEGQQRENMARLENAKADLERYRKLYEEQLITRQQVATQEALVQEIEGALASNAAQVNSAKLNLAYTRITAPTSGRLGLRQVDPGNFVRSSDPNGIVVITQIRPISVIFTVPETDLPAVLDAYRGRRQLPVEAWDRTDSVRLAEGTLQTVDNQIDPTTGTIRMRATFPNDNEQLFPNQFVNVRLKVRTVEDATVIPTAAVQRASFGTFVYVVQPDNTVSISKITLGPTQGDRVAVASGVEPGARVVVEGVDELTDGARVEIVTGAGNPVGSGAGTDAGGDGGAKPTSGAAGGGPSGRQR